MCQFIETIKLENREFENLNFHLDRLSKTVKDNFKTKIEIDKQWFNLPDELDNGIYKCRLVYSFKVESIEYIAYTAKSIKSLKKVYHNEIDYNYKKTDRSLLNNLHLLREDCDDILIIKNGFVTDTSFCNIVFFDGENWFTSNTQLLKGTKRQSLIELGVLKEIKIMESDINHFVGAKPINSMLDFYKTEMIPIDRIY